MYADSFVFDRGCRDFVKMQSTAADRTANAPGLAGIPALRPVVTRAPHVIDYRVSVPFFGRRYYFAFFAGHEQRQLLRLVAESQRKR